MFSQSSFLKSPGGISNLIAKAVLVFVIFLPSVWAQDPGIRDTVRIEVDSLIVGQSRPVRLIVSNDDFVTHIQAPFCFSSTDSGFAILDSVVYVNRLGDPAVLDVRILFPKDLDGISPDTVQFGLFSLTGNALPPGNTTIVDMYFTGLKTGLMSIDSIAFPQSGGTHFNHFLFLVASELPFVPYVVAPEYVAAPIRIASGEAPPNIAVGETLIRKIAGDEVSLNIEVASPVGYPVTTSLTRFSGYDDSLLSPVYDPELTYNESTGQFDLYWSSSAADVGIWIAEISACDSAEACRNAVIQIQIVENNSYIIEFETKDNSIPFVPEALKFGNFDEDVEPELISTNRILFDYTPSLILFDNLGNGLFNSVYGQEEPVSSRLGLQLGFIDSDEYLDAVEYHRKRKGDMEIQVLLGNGENGFTTSSSAVEHWGITGTIGKYNDDEFLDYAIGGQNFLRIFGGNSNAEFNLITSLDVEDSVMTLESEDLNNDGYTDFIVGYRQGIKVYLGSSSGVYSLHTTYQQVYGSVDIDVTNQGSDFNNDNIFDMCVATPSVGESSSELVVYLGNGDGTFEQLVTREVLGQINASLPGDFNGDGFLDIAFLNNAKRYLSIIYGDGDGIFTNELRYEIPQYRPYRMAAADIDLDGDIDIAVATWDNDLKTSLLLYENQKNPTGYNLTSVDFNGKDNAQLELVSPSGKRLNRISSSMPTGSYFRRNLNLNDKLDDYASLNLVENGDYVLTVRPDPSQPLNTPFTIEFEVDGQLHRLASEAVMTTDQYDFSLRFSGGLGNSPVTGSFVYVNPPVFSWPNKSNVHFQLAADLDFALVLIDTTIAGSVFQPPSALAVTDTTTYYWRIKSVGAAEFAPLHVFNLLSSNGACGDIDGIAGPINMLDMTFLVNRIFKYGDAPPDADLADLNSDSNVNILDLVFLINYMFRGGLPPTCK